MSEKNLKYFYQKFSETEYGKKLVKEIRYGMFKPDSVSNELWEEILGPDVNNLKHHLVSWEITEDFLLKNQKGKWSFDDREKKLLLTSAIMHDWGEAVVGDIMFDHKNGELENEEWLALWKILNEIDFEESDRLDFEDSFEKVLKGKDEKLTRAFNAIERSGYLFTGIRAWQKGREIFSADKIFSDGLLWLANNVALNQTKKLIEYGEDYPAVSFYLDQNKEILNKIFSEMPERIFLKYKEEERGAKKSQFREAGEIWKNQSGKKDWCLSEM